MFDVDEPELLHSLKYRTSGSSGPRDMMLKLFTARYRCDLQSPPVFLATADLQGRETAKSNRLLGEFLADEIAALQELGELPELDICLLCGDFYDYPDLRKLGGTGDVTEALNALANSAKRTFIVLGNHDTVREQDLVPSASVLDVDTVQVEELVIGGVSGIIGDPKRNNRKLEDEFLAAVSLCSSSRTDILLLHQGPQGPSDEYRGCEQINQQLQRRSDLLVLFGHCHWKQPFHKEHRNLFCNVDARAIVFIPDLA